MVRCKILFACAAVIAAICLPGGRCQAQAASGPFATKAVVEADHDGKPLPLQRNEQIAFMFAVAIDNLENACHVRLSHFCTMDELIRGDHDENMLKFDPRSADPNFTYVLNISPAVWELKVVPKKSGLGGFYFVNFGDEFSKKFYNPKGEASVMSVVVDGYSVTGDGFNK
jgi:hypothetical protein